MKKFVVIYRVPVKVAQKWRKETSPEEMKKQEEKLGQEWAAWMEKNKKSIVDRGLPLGKNTRMSLVGAEPMTNDLNYYNVIEAESVEDAVAMHKDNPHIQIPNAFIDIMEVPHIGL